MRTAHGILGLMLVFGAACPPRVAPAGGEERRGAAVRPGLDVLLDDSLHLVRGRRVALLTNQAGVDSRGVSGVERLRAAGVDLVALFSPEHGFRGAADPGEAVPSTVDSATGLPIYSLYGRNSAPTDSQLAGIDLMLVDLQDVGARYYTYLWTTIEVMRAAGRKGIPVVVLDRPDPLGGAVQGNVLEAPFRSAVGALPIPMRFGSTPGELALLARSELSLTTDLTVVPVAGWRRGMYFDETGLPFVPPSPNLRSLEAMIHYPGLCLFEGTTLSVGRGTDRAFERIGAPGLDTAAVLAALRSAGLPGVAFSADSFTPRHPGDGKYADTLLAGIRLQVTDRARYDPTVTAMTLLSIVARVGGIDPFAALQSHLQRLYGAAVPVDRLRAGDLAGVMAGWGEARRAFLERRRPFLLYPE
jgi:uncharacterized protein YbbC (DUF1343 family)